MLLTAIGSTASAEDRQTGAVAGAGFFDLNEDRAQQPGEPGASDFAVELVSASEGWRKSVRTDSTGHYRFADLAPGKYSVQFDSDGHATTTPWAVGVAVRDTETTVNFGIK
ncbi:carboxypeptidase-like regulatory domain-containing protein [Amycolatopsis minnesotensis]|uniref:SD-repeat containing protein B domain-containing protein n=1 Tax=Amycolatopsis minnesotensis TaxID=337894 RepID=A0ABN2SP56_9PSEU